MATKKISFQRIDLDRHSGICTAFRRDSYACSFGAGDAFYEDGSDDGVAYIARLRGRIAELPEGYIHVWQGETIVGQLEMRLGDEPGTGYINLFYLVPSVRGTDAGDQLHAYALGFFQKLAVTKIQLSVSPTNRRAIAYYRKHGWRELGPRPGREQVHLMELSLRDAP